MHHSTSVSEGVYGEMFWDIYINAMTDDALAYSWYHKVISSHGIYFVS